ncbi:short-chain dehydrogenase [Sandarakinorhabdus cyanobacteriorum]|uniref:Short-chain dehydrogenase n=1 Tax=Sandarakinorhabdus cyanobacteriorum TaxID=1981098 RepID=A0A255YXZ6_9SPHN|nr:glucose 1-dehydrogenase [Sandarakinorhabdus cyanobacteriorum]OYQ34049.1 short-chain dehydrogenase [Sandarakinorhabdus cyanobacteriorum]
MERLTGKVALVTGAGSGIGAAAARRLAQDGAAVLLTDIDAAAGDETAQSVAAGGGRVAFCAHDVTDSAAWVAAVARAVAEFGRLNILVNNAGISGGRHELLDHSLEAWRQILAVNLDGVFLGLRHAGPQIAAAGGGSVINISSILGKVGLGGAAAYCASKGAVTLLSKAAALEWAPLNIRVNSVHPGFIDTPLVSNALATREDGNEMRVALMAAHPLGRFGLPREIGDAIAFLASDESSFMTGAELVVDGGYTAQ